MAALDVTIHNERTKLLANALDRTSTACVAVGLIAPVVGGGFRGNWDIVASIAIWLFAALVLHLGARRVLAGLRE